MSIKVRTAQLIDSLSKETILFQVHLVHHIYLQEVNFRPLRNLLFSFCSRTKAHNTLLHVLN